MLDIRQEILNLKKEKGVLILAHFYEDGEIQELADHVGDSYFLAETGMNSDAKIILLAGVVFMGESVKILSPDKKVIVPDLRAGCSLVTASPFAKYKAWKDAHPNSVMMTYINSSAEVKSISDVICTSSNAEKIINSIQTDKPIIFAPDINLGKYLVWKTGRDLVLWKGSCLVHESFSIDKILDLHRRYPRAKFIAHPESQSHILRIASYIGSTKGMIEFVKKDPSQEFIVATEVGILYQMRKEVPNKVLIPAPAYQNNICACSECPYMKMNTMEKLYQCLLTEEQEVVVEESIRTKAALALNRMMDLSN